MLARRAASTVPQHGERLLGEDVHPGRCQGGRIALRRSQYRQGNSTDQVECGVQVVDVETLRSDAGTNASGQPRSDVRVFEEPVPPWQG